MRKIYFLLICLYFASCSNWALKEKCEQTNWFDYSQNLAFQGKYLEEDGYVKDCKKVDRTNATQLDQGFKLGRDKMCGYEEIYKRAVDGQPVFFNFCDGLDQNLMKKKHVEGLEIFCTKDRGYSYGKSGREYLKVCKANQEVSFLPSYYKGRKEYLTQFIIDKKEQEKRQLLSVQSDYNVVNSTANAYASIPSHLLHCSVMSVYNSNEKRDESKNVCSEPAYISSQRNEISGMLSRAQANLKESNLFLKETQNKITWAQHELSIIPE